jgi:hypothetical protein
MREFRKYGSVRGALSNERLYRDWPTTPWAPGFPTNCIARTGQSLDDGLTKYLNHLTIIRELPSWPEIDRLQRANETVKDLQTLLPFGSGSIKTFQDGHYRPNLVAVEKSLTAVHLVVKFMRRYERHFHQKAVAAGLDRLLTPAELKVAKDAIIFSACGAYMGAGECDQYAGLAIIYHAPRMKGDETIEIWSLQDPSHQTVVSSGVVMDGWTCDCAHRTTDSIPLQVGTAQRLIRINKNAAMALREIFNDMTSAMLIDSEMAYFASSTSENIRKEDGFPQTAERIAKYFPLSLTRM